MSSFCAIESTLETDIERYNFVFVKHSDFPTIFLPSVTCGYLHESEMEPKDLEEPDLVVNDAFADSTYEEDWNRNSVLREVEDDVSTDDVSTGSEEEVERMFLPALKKR